MSNQQIRTTQNATEPSKNRRKDNKSDAKVTEWRRHSTKVD